LRHCREIIPMRLSEQAGAKGEGWKRGMKPETGDRRAKSGKWEEGG
jgi:hypothetical protein